MKAPKEIIQKLRNYFTKREDVILAYLFGSQAEGTATLHRSDYDIAVYFVPKSGTFEYEADTGIYPQEGDVNAELGQITGTEVDLVVLNRAPADIVFTVINGTIILTEKDHDLFMRLLLQSSFDAEVYRDMVHEFAAIAARSRSLSLVDIQRLEKDMIFMQNEMILLEQFGAINQLTFQQDPRARRTLERSVEMLINAGLNVAKTLLASGRRNIPPANADVMKHLGYLAGFATDSAEWLARSAMLHNIAAHEYLDLEFAKIKTFLTDEEKHFNYLIQYTKQVIQKQKEEDARK